MIARLFRFLQRFDWWLMLGILVLFLLGISAIYSVELSQETANFLGVRKQLFALVLGLTALLFAAQANYIQLRNLGRIMYLIGLLLLIAVLFFGSTIRGTTGWFDLGIVSFQPVEFMKLALIVQLARYFGEHARRRFGWQEIFGSGMLTAVPVGLTMLQPDLGSALLLVGIWGVYLLAAGIRAIHLLALGASGVIASIIGWFYVLADYQKDRLLVFMDPQADPLGSGYNIVQAQIAIGSGQLFGRGLGFGSQSQLKFLPESQTDFIFAVIAEELGFLGILLLLIAFGLVFRRMILAASYSRDHFTSYLLIGIFASLFIQMSVNIGVNLAILPATGVALPFVSYGGSSLLISLLMVGVAQSIIVRQHPADRYSGA